MSPKEQRRPLPFLPNIILLLWFKVSVSSESTEAGVGVGQLNSTEEQVRDTNPESGGGGEGGLLANDTQDDGWTLVVDDMGLDQTTELQKTVVKIITIKDFET